MVPQQKWVEVPWENMFLGAHVPNMFPQGTWVHLPHVTTFPYELWCICPSNHVSTRNLRPFALGNLSPFSLGKRELIIPCDK